MRYGIEVKRSAAKVLKNIPKVDQRRIIKKIDSLADQLPNPKTTKMKGNNPFHKIRVGDYRIIYEIQEDILPARGLIFHLYQRNYSRDLNLQRQERSRLMRTDKQQ